MRPPLAAAAAAAAAALLFSAAPARAEGPDAGLAVLVGGATIFAGFAVGATFIATSSDQGTPTDLSNAKTQAGWWLMESGFVLAPITSHAVVGEWGRGALWASLPAATTLGTIPVFVEKPGAVQHGSLEEQRVMWGCFVGGLGLATASVIDAAFAPGRAAAVHVAPMVGAATAGLLVGGAL
jgi:hypothetical protein